MDKLKRWWRQLTSNNSGQSGLAHTHHYSVDGENLPDRSNGNKKQLYLTIGLVAILITMIHFFAMSIRRMAMLSSQYGSVFSVINNDSIAIFRMSNLFAVPTFTLFIGYIVGGVVAGWWLYSKMNYGGEPDIAYGQKGDSRFTTIDEIKKQYRAIPNSADEYPGIATFDGIGGIPVSHYRGKYYIDRDTVNSAILGVSRSGKGETTITPMIDILSRAEIQTSMVLNDPKGELYAASKDTLEARGYNVEVLNLQDPMQSMSYNPLQLVIDAWVQGNPEEASKRANSIAFTLYNDPNMGENAFFYTTAQSAVTAIILTLVEHCVETDQVEKITMGNVANMLNTLGQLNWADDNTGQEKNALDEWFKGLPSGHVAQKRYGATSFAGAKTRGSILSTANDGLQPFVDPSFVKMTSRNSMDLKQIGFPKYLNGQLSEALVNERVEVSFVRNNEERTLIKEYRVKIKAQGRFSLNFDEFEGDAPNEEDGIQPGDFLLLKYIDPETNKASRLIYQLNFQVKTAKNGDTVMKKKAGEEDQPQLKREVVLELKKNTFDKVKQHVRLMYSNQPTAVFMIVPDYDSSNHALASIFTKQLYTELSSNAVETKGNKCFRRVQYILDEFGNMPPIDDMDQVMTVCLGRNILFNLVLQSFTQLERKYGEASDTIKENCQNLIYIMSKNEDTIEEISKQAGEKTEISISSNEQHGDLDNSISKNAESIRLISPTRLRQFIEGEQLIIRSLHRQDLERNKVRPYPIFNTKDTVMPYRYQFLSRWIDTDKELNEIDIPSKHAMLSLEELTVDFAPFIRNEKERRAYEGKNSDMKKEKQGKEKYQMDNKPKGPGRPNPNKKKSENDKTVKDLAKKMKDYLERGIDSDQMTSFDRNIAKRLDKQLSIVIETEQVNTPFNEECISLLAKHSYEMADLLNELNKRGGYLDEDDGSD